LSANRSHGRRCPRREAARSGYGQADNSMWFVPAVHGRLRSTFPYLADRRPQPSFGFRAGGQCCVLIIACLVRWGWQATSSWSALDEVHELGVLFRKGDALQYLGRGGCIRRSDKYMCVRLTALLDAGRVTRILETSSTVGPVRLPWSSCRSVSQVRAPDRHKRSSAMRGKRGCRCAGQCLYVQTGHGVRAEVEGHSVLVRGGQVL